MTPRQYTQYSSVSLNSAVPPDVSKAFTDTSPSIPQSERWLNGQYCQYIGRYAPSPTGPLHMGSLIAAVASYCDARANNGKWLLRIEDIDETRSKPEYADDIITTLHQFGFRWDGEISFQSNQQNRYEAALAKLIDLARVYACRCSRKEIADSMPMLGIDGAVYAGTCRHLQIDHQTNAIRLITDNTVATFQDRVQGWQQQNIASDIGDFILKRRDGLFAYQLAVVVDDATDGVTHVVRGADLLDATPRQIYLQRLLGYATPSYLHIPVLVNAAGQKLSKQTLAPAISSKDAVATLITSLRYLRQPVGALQSNATLTPEDVLNMAVKHWQPALIASTRVQHIDSP
jgi:glutamyl-Q tRNA(Asp) synthetase